MFKCSCLSIVEVKLKKTKRGYEYVECPLCKTRTGIRKEWGYTGHNHLEIIEDLEYGK